MTINLDPDSFFVFDLDDTLYSELEFLKSGYKCIAAKLTAYLGADIYEKMWENYLGGRNVFEYIVKEHGALIPYKTVAGLLDIYRYHEPSIVLRDDAGEFLDHLKSHNVKMGLITDGRGITQRNKLKSLGLATGFFSDVVISEEFGSEKPNIRNFLYFVQKYPGMKFYFLGDNTVKDFVAPDELGWVSICLKDNGNNIHKQNLNNLSPSIHIITSYKEINTSFRLV